MVLKHVARKKIFPVFMLRKEVGSTRTLTFQDNDRNCYVITAYKRSCGKVMFLHLSAIMFTWGGGLCPGEVSDWGVSVQGWGLCPGVFSVQGVSVRGSLSGRPPVRAGRMHPTGMHSCLTLRSYLPTVQLS